MSEEKTRMMTERGKYRKKPPEDPANGHYKRVVKMSGKEERVKVPRTRKGGIQEHPATGEVEEERGGRRKVYVHSTAEKVLESHEQGSL